MTQDFMTVKDVAERLGCSPASAYRFIASRRIPSVRLAGHIRVPRAAWERWVAATTEEAMAGVGHIGNGKASR